MTFLVNFIGDINIKIKFIGALKQTKIFSEEENINMNLSATIEVRNLI